MAKNSLSVSVRNRSTTETSIILMGKCKNGKILMEKCKNGEILMEKM